MLRDIEQGDFHSELDREIAAGVVNEIESVADRRQLGPEAYEGALDSVRALVPQVGDDGFRHIAGTRLTKKHEERIASRLKSAEIDMNSETGTWGGLPEPVKLHLARHGEGLNIEPASHCTVGCSFCVFANHGPIAAKASFGSILDIVEYFYKHQRLNGPRAVTDTLYHGSDPFDLKWQETNYERDYTDLGAAYRQIVGPGRELFTSTAVPLGEEWRVLRYLIDKFDREDKESFRFSITNGNHERIKHIANIINFLDERQTKQLMAHSHVENAEFIVRRGQSFLKQDEFRLRDIYGPESADRVVIGATAIRGVVLRGATMSYPYGYTQYRLGLPVNGGRRYSIPRYYRATDDLDGSFYPPAIIDHLIVSSDGSVIEQTEVQRHDPFRALLRVAKGLDLMYEANNYQSDMAMQRRFTELFTESLEDMRAHIAKSPDETMSMVFRLLRARFSEVKNRDTPADLDK